MKNKNTKKYLLLAGLIVVLIAVGYINFAIGNDADTQVAANTDEAIEVEDALQADDLAVMSTEDYFKDYKANRESVRTTEVAYLDSIIENENSDADTVKDAQSQKIEIVRAMEAELTIEGLLVAVGFSDAIVTVQEGSVNVVLDAAEISSEEAAKILEIVREETDEPAQNIKVILQD
ncbi:MAG: SpoIIIAH-like family protein [Eubacteriales bacterium]|nr:SpoIIIAH-like family protein [Eubacteriales bacterium]